MRYILVLLILGIISCNPKQKSVSNEEPITSDKVENSNEDKLSPSWNNTELKELEVNGFYPNYLPSGDAIIYSTSNFQGLWLYNLYDQSKTELTNVRGAGYRPVISNNSVLYQKKAKKTTYEKLDLGTKKSSAISNITNEESLESYANKENSRMLAWVASDLNSIDLYSNGKKVKSISPGGFKNIVNASISPNEERILLEVSGKGGYIADLNGEIIHDLGELDQPSWINDDEIVYAKIKDDGMKTTSGDIYVKILSSQKEYSISSDFSGILENPQANKKGDQVIANSPDGKLIIMSKN